MSNTIGNPLERAKLGKLGGKREQSAEEHNNIKTSEHNNAKVTDEETLQKSSTTAGSEMKRTTVYIPKSLAQWLKVYAATHNEDMSGIVVRELENLRRREEGK